MDVDRLLNLERRTGVKESDIDDFERKVNDVEAAIKGLMSGALKPEEVKVEGIETEEEKAENERKRLERKRAYEEKERKLQEQRKKEERERWWAGAEIFKPKTETGLERALAPSEEEVDKKTAILNRYKADYSRWNSWTPTDEATLAEAAEAQQREEDLKNKEFEKNNAEFCNQFVADMEQRKKLTAKKQESADISRLKGNRYFKAKQYDRALEYYMEALKDVPFDAKTVNNIAQVYIKTKSYDDALEFLARTLYLEPTNIKALSRKALVLGEQGNVTEAVEVIKTALALEPANPELIAQARELDVIAAERAAEQMVVAATAAESTAAGNTTGAATVGADSAPAAPVATVAPVAPAVATVAPAAVTAAAAPSAPPGLGTVDRLATHLRSLQSNLAGGGELDTSLLKTDFAALSTLTPTLRGQSDAKVYARTSGALALLLEICASAWSRRTAVPVDVPLLSAALRLLAVLVDGQRASKLLLLDHKMFSLLRSVLQECQVSNLEATESAMEVLHVSCQDDIAVKTRTAVTSDKALMGLIAGTLGNVCFRANSSNATLTALERSAVALGAKILKITAFADAATSALPTLDAVTGASVVCGVACAMHYAAHQPVSAKSTTLPVSGAALADITNAELLELLVETALGLSQVDILRPHFAQVTPMAENPVNKSQFSASLCGVIVHTITTHPRLEVNATAALMNACLEPSNAVRKAIVEAGGAAIALTQLSFSAAQRAQEDGVTLVRKAGLLGRLAGEEAVQKQLLQPENYRLLCRQLALPSKDTNPEQWQLDERAHYVRILANLTTPSEECMRIGMSENVLGSLLAIFPTPRDDCGEITATTVTLMPKDLTPAILLGNAARCLMPYADVPAHAQVLYASKTLLGVEKLICAMASCPDMRVRKNIAILLAKGCRVPGVRERMTQLRGMQMMIELQSAL